MKLWFVSLQASQMIVSYDEHEVNNTFKFGVIYQKFRQVSNPRIVLMEQVLWHQGLFVSGTLSLKFGPVVNFETMFKDTVTLVSLRIMHFLLLGCFPDSKYDVAEEKSV